MTTPSSLKAEELSEPELYAQEFELRKILDKNKTPPQMERAMELVAEIRRRVHGAAATPRSAQADRSIGPRSLWQPNRL